MRILTWAALLCLALVTFFVGHPQVAFAIAGLKALLVGWEFMELKCAHPLHALTFAVATSGLVLALVLTVGWWPT